MIRIVPLVKEHIDLLTDPALEPGLRDTLSRIPMYWEALVACNTSFAGFDGDDFLGCAGYVSPWPGVAEVWVWVLPGTAEKHPKSLHKIVRNAIAHMEQNVGIYRISCEVRSDSPVAIRWVERLGFSYEGTLKRRGPDGSDSMLYAKVRD